MSGKINSYKRIVSAIDGSKHSDIAMHAALSLAERSEISLLAGCHVYAARLHRSRFGDMEPGLPESYKGDEIDKLRGTHEDLITEGLNIISDSYLEPLASSAREKEMPYRCLALEGRNYKGIMRAAADLDADLVVLGALGHGGRLSLGSTAERVLLYSQTGDVMIIRHTLDFEGRPIVVGVDGSENSYSALLAAAEIARAFGADLKAVSVYDPHFHTGVFKNIASMLSEDAQEKFDLPSQERLHNEIIDEGLERLYRDGLEKGAILASSMGVNIEAEVLAGKVCPQILNYASDHNAALVVAGRWGLHREPESLIGSNSLDLARQSPANVLVVSPSPVDMPLAKEREKDMKWTAEAKKILERIPDFARPMACKAVESRLIEEGRDTVTLEDILRTAHRG